MFTVGCKFLNHTLHFVKEEEEEEEEEEDLENNAIHD